MIKMSRKAKKAMAVALTAGMLASTAVTPVMAATQGWKQNSKGWWYQNADGTYPANKWSLINGKWYYFDANGYMLANKWVQDKAGKWYFVGADGAMKVNAWAKDKAGLWYWLTDDGSMFTGGWGHINGEWYFFQNNGVMQSGVVKVEGETYYLGSAAEGWMHTGKVNVAGTEYNFDAKSGACTDAKAPAAAKAFDKTGKEVENNIDIEAVDGITGVITNALPDYQTNYGNVLIAGSDAYLKVLVSDKDGKPVANTPVSLTSKVKGEVSTEGFSVKGNTVQVTDANGYATFVIGAESGKHCTDLINEKEPKYKFAEITPTSGHRALLSLTATAVATNQVYKTDLSFATINLGSVDVVNDNKSDDEYLVVKSTNATDKVNAVETTYTVDGNAKTEYVTTQQVNEKGSTKHKVKLTLEPQIRIPYANTTSVVDKYQQDVNKEVTEYSVYQNGGTTSFKVEGIPAGLKYATLNFSSIDISDYTRVEIQAYKAGKTDKVGDAYKIDGPTTQKDFGYQIPVQPNDALDIEVKIISEGQVNDDQNAGLVVKDVTGLYDTKTSDTTKDIALANSVKWSIVENKYSNEESLDAEKAVKYLNTASLDEKYYADKNTYSYQVPVYPYTGNAIMTVKDVNKKVVGYFTIPTVNQKTDKFQNKNVLVDPNAQAILVSKDEAFNTVGTITANGNSVEVNSEETGITAIEAKLNIAGFEDEINLINNTVYTSVHWSPIPTTKSVESKDFYALAGQNIVVKAQLVDNNGNKVSQSGQQITYSYGSNGEIKSLGAVDDTKATATAYTSTTDANGQATLKLTSGDDEAFVKLLHASSANYNVQLVIGEDSVTNANLRWVEPGLSFTSSVDETDKDFERAITLDTDIFGTEADKVYKKTSELKAVLAKDTGSNWIFGYEVIGETQDDHDDSDNVTLYRWVDSISGLNVDVTKAGDGEIAADTKENGTVKLTSKKAGATTLTGTINEKSVVSGQDIVFKVATKKPGSDKVSYAEYKNVGEGTPSISSSLNLPITWGTVGTKADIITPKGTSLIVDKTAADDEFEIVYVKAFDEFGTPITKKDVEITITYTGKAADGTSVTAHTTYNSSAKAITEGENKNVVKATDDVNGLVEVKLLEKISTLLADKEFVPETATISAKIGNETTQKTIQYKKAPENVSAFAVGTAKYVPGTSTSNPKVEVIFTQPVNKDSINKEMFTITANGSVVPVKIANADIDEKDNKKVILTLGDQHKNGLTNDVKYTVTVGEKTVDGVDYVLCDTYGNELSKKESSTGVKNNQTIFYTVDSTLDFVVSGKNVTVKVNGTNVDTEDIVCAWNSDQTFLTDSENDKIVSFKSGTTQTRSALTKPVTVTFYYNGAVVTKTFELTDTEKQSVAQGILDAETFTAPSATYAKGTVVTVPTKTGYTAEITAVTDTNSIFDTWSSGALKINSTTLVVATDKTATVEVTYTDNTYSSVKKVVTYNVALADSTADDDSDADTITFTPAP